MKIIKAAMVAAALLLAPVWAFSANLGWMRISLIEGDVQIKTAEARDWGAAALNGPVTEGDDLWVPGDGRVELQLSSGAYVRLDGNSALQILALDRDTSQLYLSQGRVYVYNNIPSGGMIQIDTPDASTRAFDASIFRIDMSDRYTDVAVYKGYVETENQVGRTRVNADEMVSLAQNTDGEVGPMGPPDEWERWNKKRNGRIAGRRGVSSRYLPPELRSYATDFDANGRWVNVPEYGYCWTPTVIVGAGWAPYRAGRWAWIGGDYVWISSEPWGWAPYHYGRWTFVARFGWCWVPPLLGDVYWGPGFVGWVWTPDYVAWVPLAPREVYYGRGSYGRYSVNITQVTVNRVEITNIYRNVRVNNGVVVVNRNSFAAGSPRNVALNRDVIERRIFVRDNISVGAPAIQPSREGRLMSPRPIPAAKLPPPQVRSLDSRQLKESRLLVRERDKSVMNRGERPRELPLKTVTVPRSPGAARSTEVPAQPGERGGTGRPASPARKGETPQVGPQERRPAAPEAVPQRREPPQTAPPERRSVAPEMIPPKGEKPLRGAEGRPAVTPEGPALKGERPRVAPPERRPAAPEAVPQRREPPQTAPPERRPVAPEMIPPKGEKPQVRRQEQRPVVPEVLPPKEAAPQVEREERRTVVPEGTSPGGERPRQERGGGRPAGEPGRR